MLYWGVCFIAFSAAFGKLGTIHFFGISLAQALIIYLLFVAVILGLIKKRHSYDPKPLDFSLIAFGVYLWISNYLINPHSEWGIRVATDYIRSLVCYFLVILLINDERKFRHFVLTLILASTVMALSASVFSRISEGVTFSYEGREGLSGLAGHYIDYAIYCLVSVPLAYFCMRNMSKIWYFVMLPMIALLSFATLFSGSRGAILSFMVAALLIFLLNFNASSLTNRGGHPAVAGLFFFLFSFCAFLVFWFKGGHIYIQTLTNALLGHARLDASLAGRIALNKASLSLFLSKPIFGIGIDATREILGNVTHNQWLQILTELGLIGMTIALLITHFTLYTCVQTFKKLRQNNANQVLNITYGAAISYFIIIIWGFYENIGYIAAHKWLFMLMGLIRSIEVYSSNLTNHSQAGHEFNTICPSATGILLRSEHGIPN